MRNWQLWLLALAAGASLLVTLAFAAGTATATTSEKQLAYAGCSGWTQSSPGHWNFISQTLVYSGGDTIWMPPEIWQPLAAANTHGIVHCGGVAIVAGILKAHDQEINIPAGQVWNISFPLGDPNFGLQWKASGTTPVLDWPHQLAFGWANWQGGQISLNWSDDNRRLAMWGNVETIVREENQQVPVGFLMISGPWATQSTLNAFGSRTMGANQVYYYQHPKQDPPLGAELIVLYGTYPETPTPTGPTSTMTPTPTRTPTPTSTPGQMRPRAFLPFVAVNGAPARPELPQMPSTQVAWGAGYWQSSWHEAQYSSGDGKIWNDQNFLAGARNAITSEQIDAYLWTATPGRITVYGSTASTNPGWIHLWWALGSDPNGVGFQWTPDQPPPTATPIPTLVPTATPEPTPPADPPIPAWTNQQWAYGSCFFNQQWHPVEWYRWDKLLYESSTYLDAMAPNGITTEDIWCLVVAERGGVLHAGNDTSIGAGVRFHFRYWQGTPRGGLGFTFTANPR